MHVGTLVRLCVCVCVQCVSGMCTACVSACVHA